MSRMFYATVAVVAAVALPAVEAQALPVISAPADGAGSVHKTQGFGIYVGPGYGYDRPRYRYADPYYYDGYSPYYSRYYYDGPPRRYYNSRYRGERRYFRRLHRQAP